MAAVGALREHIVAHLKKVGGSMPAAQAGVLYKSNAEFDATVKAAGSFKKFIDKNGGDLLEFVDGVRAVEGGKRGCDMVRLKDPASGIPATSPQKDRNLSRKDSNKQEPKEGGKFFKVSNLPCYPLGSLSCTCVNQVGCMDH